MSRPFSIRLILLALMSVMTVEAHAEGFWHALKNWVDSADIKGCDTTYLHLPKEGFIGYGNVYLAGTKAFLDYDQGYTQRGIVNVKSHLSTRVATLLSAGISYRGWGLSYSKDFSSHGDSEWSFCSYGQGYGLELRQHNSHSLSGVMDVEESGVEKELNIKANDFHQRMTLGNLYYVFGRKRFSLPAAMSHTIIQKRSSGSWLAILNFWHSATTIDDDMLSFPIGEDELAEGITGTAKFRKLSQTQVNVGGGYAYNFIFGDAHCLFHISAMPMVSMWHRNRRYYDVRLWDSNGQLQHDQSHAIAIGQRLTLNGTVHSSFVYNFSRYVTGVMAMANIDSFPGKSNFSLYTFDWSSRFFFGVRF